MNHVNIRRYLVASTLSLVTAALLFILSGIVGRIPLFLLMNGDGGQVADWFFYFASYGGDGMMWIPVLLITLFVLRRKDTIALLVTAFACSTLLTQLFKLFIFPSEPRPTRAITDGSFIHTVTGVEVHSLSSFPSGHTGTAFCFYLLFCLVIDGNWWLWCGFLYAAAVGYARIYLAQHFPLDVAGGIVVALISVFISLKVQRYWWKKTAQRAGAGDTGGPGVKDDALVRRR